MHRGIIVAKGGRIWVYQYLFAKKDRDNIGDVALEAFKNLAKGYSALTDPQIEQLVNDEDFVEICDVKKDQVQK